MARFWISIALAPGSNAPSALRSATPTYEGSLRSRSIAVRVEFVDSDFRPENSNGRVVVYADSAAFGRANWSAKGGAIDLSDVLHVVVHETAGTVEINIPLVCTQGVFLRPETDRLLICSDPRLLYSPGDDLDPCGIYSLLQFGTIAPPFSPWRTIRRLHPGYCHRVQVEKLTLQPQRLDSWGPSRSLATVGVATHELRLDAVSTQLDKQIAKLAPDRDAVVLFSGGVDSSLIGARVESCGMAGRLFHYSFGDGTAETRLATEMAGHLKLPLEIVQDSNDRTEAMLAAIGATYPLPFTDHSCLPTFLLCRAALDRLADANCFLDGTGADGDFALFGKVAGWQKVYRVPRSIRRAAALLYARGAFWKKTGRLEYALRLLTRASRLPLLLGGPLAVNPLDGIAYRFDAAVRDNVVGELETWLDDCLSGLGDDQKYCAVDLIQICCNIFCQKSRPVFEAAGKHIGYPFLSNGMVRLALLQAISWPRRGERKELLKDLLARHVPAELVFRKKTPFVAPLTEKFATPTIQGALRDLVLAADGPLAHFLDRPTLATVVDAARASQPLPAQMYYFLWGVLFSSLWLKQVAAGFRNQRCEC